jgi:hypothetical protein
MGNPFGTKKFKALKAKWDKKLKNTGFEDVENEDGSLKASTHPKAISFALRDKEEREAYYGIATQLLHTYTFVDEIEKRIWEMHCEGIAVRHIMKELDMGHHKIELVIDRMQRIGKLKGENKDE